ncbi:MAG: hypothetical protein SVR08_12835, partial [Spirochaetota bacterium]|nr:hypothetical protein [Spirochaetota bacterium]
MFLMIFILIISLLFSSTAYAAVSETPFHKADEFKEDIKVLKRILLSKPDDLVALKRLIRIHFVAEDFVTAEEMASRYLSLEKEKEIAYIKIISLANCRRFKDAIKEIDKFVVTYNITAKERRLLLYKRQLYTKTKNSRGYPKSVKKIN